MHNQHRHHQNCCNNSTKCTPPVNRQPQQDCTLTEGYLTKDIDGDFIITESDFIIRFDPVPDSRCKRTIKCGDPYEYILNDLQGNPIATESGYLISFNGPHTGSCEGVICGFNEVCRKGCCVCKPGYARDKFGKCIPAELVEDSTPPKSNCDSSLLQENGGLISTQNDIFICYDKPNNNIDIIYNANLLQESGGITLSEDGLVISYDSGACLGVVCGSGEICIGGVCTPDPLYNPCFGVVCPPGQICQDGECVTIPNSCDFDERPVDGVCKEKRRILKEDSSFLYLENNDALNYDRTDLL